MIPLFPFPEFLSAMSRVIRNPVYFLLTVSTICNCLGIAGTIAFMPKYLASQYDIPLWQANIVMGMYIGGVFKMFPEKYCRIFKKRSTFNFNHFSIVQFPIPDISIVLKVQVSSVYVLFEYTSYNQRCAYGHLLRRPPNLIGQFMNTPSTLTNVNDLTAISSYLVITGWNLR